MNIFCLRERDLFAEPGFDEIKACAAEESTRRTVLCFSGEKAAGELFREALGIEPARVRYIGPSDASVEPIWWWGFIHAVCESDVEDVRLYVVEDSKLKAYEQSTDTQSSIGQILYIWSYLSGSSCRLSISWIEKVELFASILAEVEIPRPLIGVARTLETYLRLSALTTKEALLQPNALSWSRCRERKMSSAYCNLVNLGSIALWNKSAREIATLVGVSRETFSPPAFKELEILGTAMERITSKAEDRLLRDRLTLWSGLVYVQAEMLLTSKLSGFATLGFWRSLEIYYHKVAYENGLITVNERGNWEWRIVSHGGREPTASGIIRELEAHGIELGIAYKRGRYGAVDELRWIRNNALWTHGYCCGDQEASLYASQVVARAIRDYEGARPRWRAATDRLRNLTALIRPVRAVFSTVQPE